MSERKIQVVRDLIDQFFNAHDPAAADRFLTEDFRWTGGSVGATEGRAAYQEVMPHFWAGLPDAFATEEDIFAAGDTVVARFTVTGTHEGPLWGIAPSGRSVSWQALMIYRFRGDKIARQWAAEDWAALLGQVGYATLPWDRPAADVSSAPPH